jgi:Outer membrane protein beta-barrel domain
VTRIAAAVLFAIAALAPAPASAQVSVPGPYVIDLRGAMSGAPGDVSFYPPIPTTMQVPQRAFGFAAGAHVYAFRIGVARLGFGVDLMRVRGSADTDAAAAGAATGAATTSTGTLNAAMTVTTVAPQLSFNFGGREGWSYLSAGYGTASTHAEVNIPASAGGEGGSARDRRVPTLNFGGGARWFVRGHLAVGFDVRFHHLRATDDAPSKQIVGLSVGVGLR